jgi:uncharacterized protein YxjI
MKVKKYDEFINEEIGKQTLAAGILGGALALGSVGVGGSYLRDKSSAPTEQTSEIKKEIPNEFFINEKLLTIGHDFWITNKNRENFGKIEERVISVGKKFEYFDNTGKLDVIAKAKFLTLYTNIIVDDSNGSRIGRIEEEIIESIGSFFDGQNVYSLYDSNDKLIGKSKASIVFRNSVEIYDMSDNLVAVFYKPVVQFSDRWRCEIKDSSIDKRLIMFIPVYISSNRTSSSSSSSSKSK